VHKTALVTGGAGFIGSHLTDRLLADGWRVVCLDSFEDYYPREYKELNIAQARTGAAFELREASLLSFLDDPNALDRLLSASDVVFHLAAQPGVRSSWGTTFRVYTDNNILATQILLEGMRRVGGPRLVYGSTSSVYGDTDVLPMREDAICRPYSPYGVSKLAAENLCHLYRRNFGVESVILRFFTVYGPRQRPDMGFHRFIRAVLEGGSIPVYGDGSQTRDFTYVSDIIDGVEAAASAPDGSVLNLGGGSRVSLADVLDLLGEVMGQEVRLDHRERQAGDVRDTSASLEESGRVLGYAPEVGLAEGLAREVAWMRDLRGARGFPWGVDATG
jgi:nucleoside-diphosphate-sugar epimerase